MAEDVEQHREWLLSLLPVAVGGHVLDLGCGRGEDHQRFLDEQHRLHAEGRYFYSLTGYAYVGRRRA